MLENIMNKKSVNSLSCVPKIGVHSAKNIQVIIQCGTRTGYNKDITEPINNIENNDYPNCQK